MDIRRASAGLVLIVLVPLLAAGECEPNPPPATITFEQRGACNGFQSGGTTTNAGPNQAFVVFRVSTIVNQTTGAKDLPFDPENIIVTNRDSGAEANVDSDIRLASLNPFALQGRVVRAGTTETFNGAAVAVIRTTDPDGAREAAATHYTLRYSPPSAPGALMEDAAPDRTSWPYTPNCTSITF